MKLFIYIFLVLSSFLHAEWNQEFDEKTLALIDALPELQERSYLNSLSFFYKRRSGLLNDPLLESRLRKTPDLKKLILFKDFPQKDVILKKRAHNGIREVYVWELSYLLAVSEFIVPSFPVAVADKVVVIQKKETFTFADKETRTPPKALMAKVSLENYWRSHLAAYILGLGDLVGRNIGINPNGKIRLFDTESSLKYHNAPWLSEPSFKVGFLMESFEWPQYKTPLDKGTASSLEEYIGSLSSFEEDLKTYREYRGFSFDEVGMHYRLDKVRSFLVEEGRSFRDFFSFLYPKLSEGLDELNNLVSSILGREVGDGSSLFFICQRQDPSKLSSKQKEAMKKWQRRYVE